MRGWFYFILVWGNLCLFVSEIGPQNKRKGGKTKAIKSQNLMFSKHKNAAKQKKSKFLRKLKVN
jgi:hypothetical protein